MTAFLLAMLLTGCATLPEGDRRMLQEHRIPGPLYEKMLRREPLSLAEIAGLSSRHLPPSFLVRYIDDSLAEYQLTTDEVLRLRRAGVSHEVIDFLLTTAQRPTVIDYDPYWPPLYDRPIIIHDHHHHHHRH